MWTVILRNTNVRERKHNSTLLTVYSWRNSLTYPVNQHEQAVNNETYHIKTW